jgi:hypothetical protein
VSSSGDSDEEHVCPTCGKELNTLRGRKIHHSRVHDESLAKAETECEWCGSTLERKSSEIERYNNAFCDDECKGKWQSGNLSGESNPNYDSVQLKCEYCGTEYAVPQSETDNSRFCSRPCNYQWQSENLSGEDSYAWESGKVPVACSRCGEKKLKVKPAVASKRKFCDDCYLKHLSERLSAEGNPSYSGGKVEVKCAYCGESELVYPSEKEHYRCCSEECDRKLKQETQLRKGNPNWVENSVYSYGTDWEGIRTRVLQRDNYRCAICGLETGYTSP